MEILQLNEKTRAVSAEVGGKGANLLELIRLGMPVPGGMIVTTSAYEAHAIRWGLNDRLSSLIEKQDWEAVEKNAFEVLTSGPLDEDLLANLLSGFGQMHVNAVAVRSSATCEDQPDASFAGQYDTLLNVHGELELIAAVRKCWASLWNRRVLSYRHRKSIDHLSARMAVIIQEMIPADAAGVLFTMDPVMRQGDDIRIEAALGLGEAVVSGAVAGEVYRVNRDTLSRTGGNGDSGLLSPSLLVDLSRLALRVEEHFGVPQDIEFAVSDGTVHLLQARPMTSLPGSLIEQLEPLSKPSFVDKMMKPFVDERYVMAPRPLDNIAFTRLVGAHIYTIRECGGDLAPADEAAFKAQIWRQAYRFPPARGLCRALAYDVYYQFRQLRTDWQQWWDNGPSSALQSISEPVDLSPRTDEELLARADQILAVWEGPLYKRISAVSAIRADSWLKLLVTLAVGFRKRDEIMASLMTGLDNPTFQLNEEIWRLSRLARQWPEVTTAVREMAPERLETTPEGREFLEAFKSFVRKYGHREGSCWYLTTPTWRQDPDQVWRLLSSLVEAERRGGNPEQARARRSADLALIDRRLRLIPGMRKAFHWLLDRLCALHSFRENSHFDLSRPLDALQQIAAEWGRRLRERGVLESEDDIGYLTYDEIRDWLLDRHPPIEDVHALVVRRRTTYRVVNARWQEERSDALPSGDKLKGIAASPGVARGKARIIRGEHEFDRLHADEVLVSPYTNPAWTPLFATAAAVVTETGGVSSHAAIVAREYGIPAVMAVPAATRVLKDGQEILVDGNRGMVAKL